MSHQPKHCVIHRNSAVLDAMNTAGGLTPREIRQQARMNVARMAPVGRPLHRQWPTDRAGRQAQARQACPCRHMVPRVQ